MHKFCAELTLKVIRDGFIWRLIVVHGTAYDELKMDFINEMHGVLGGWQGPTLIGGIITWLDLKRIKIMEL
jgi:hypothetical protein